ncbi:MAG TPA: cytochrome c3 family protein, partial [Gemmatimonadota bacterium]|nr:cytochrome c3 family protein [Gemmatimonadota bacterium]
MRRATKKTVITGAALLVSAAAAWPLFHGPDSTAEAHEAIASAQAADTGAAAAGSAQAGSTAAQAAAGGTSQAAQPPHPGWYPQPTGAPIQGRDTLSPAQVAIQLTESATQGPAQPIPFNHHFHTTNLQISCEYCHTNSRHSEVAVMPPLATCMG